MRHGAKCVLAAWLLLSLTATGQADVLVLRNGDRVEGDIVKETPAEISIRRVFRGGKIKYIDKIKRADIASIKKTDDEDAPTSPQSTTTQPDRTASTTSSLSRDEQQKILDTVWVQLKKKDYEVAGTYLSRLINNSPREQLPGLSADVERKVDMSLADLAAEVHMRAAIEKSKGRGFRLQFVTDYEIPSLIPRLIDAYKNALTQTIQVESKQDRKPSGKATPKTLHDKPPTTSQPTASPSRGYAINKYLDNPKTFDGDKDDAHAFTGQIRYALGLLSERMRYDDKVKQDRTLRTELTGDKKRLSDLHKAVLARAGGALTPKEQEARQAEIQRRQERFRQAAEQHEMRHQRYLQRAIRMAQEQEMYEQQGQQGP